MSEQTLIFTQENKKSWNILLETSREVSRRCSESGKDFQIVIGKYSPKRSGKQLRAYWVLIGKVREYMNQERFGNNYDDDDISNYMKDQARHYKVVNGREVLASIKTSSSCTRDQMNRLINTILEFGIKHKIPDCDIADYELDKLLQCYGDN